MKFVAKEKIICFFTIWVIWGNIASHACKFTITHCVLLHKKSLAWSKTFYHYILGFLMFA